MRRRRSPTRGGRQPSCSPPCGGRRCDWQRTPCGAFLSCQSSDFSRDSCRCPPPTIRSPETVHPGPSCDDPQAPLDRMIGPAIAQRARITLAAARQTAQSRTREAVHRDASSRGTMRRVELEHHDTDRKRRAFGRERVGLDLARAGFFWMGRGCCLGRRRSTAFGL
jgi:hypothetical protein